MCTAAAAVVCRAAAEPEQYFSAPQLDSMPYELPNAKRTGAQRIFIVTHERKSCRGCHFYDRGVTHYGKLRRYGLAVRPAHLAKHALCTERMHEAFYRTLASVGNGHGYELALRHEALEYSAREPAYLQA